jgi:CRP-like cAMP-binding protein
MYEQNQVQKKVDQFFSLYPSKKIKKGALLITAHETAPSNIFFLKQGRVIQYGISVKGNQNVLNMFKPGAFFPMSAAITNSPNRYFFEASEDLTVTPVQVHEAATFLYNNPDIQLDLLQRLYIGVNGVLDRLNVLLCHDPKSMLISELNLEALRFGGDSTKKEQITLNLTQSQLADRTGLARETVSRHLSTFKQTKLITIKRGKITINNIQKFRKLVSQ